MNIIFSSTLATLNIISATLTLCITVKISPLSDPPYAHLIFNQLN